MKAGKLRHLITIEEETFEALPNGEPGEPTWSEFAGNVWAEVRPATPREVLKGQELGHVVSHAIRIRYLEGITPDMRIMFGSRVFEIAGNPIDQEERHIELMIYAKETT